MYNSTLLLNDFILTVVSECVSETAKNYRLTGTPQNDYIDQILAADESRTTSEERFVYSWPGLLCVWLPSLARETQGNAKRRRELACRSSVQIPQR